MENPKLSVRQNAGGAKSEEEDMRFNKSLQELRDLRSQLHYAADYCENTFLKAKQKKDVVENTKEYICRAVVTFVDHLGNVSSHLENQLTNDNAASETELRLNCLKQRIFACEQYAHKLALTKLRWNPHLPRYHSRYLSKPTPRSELRDDLDCTKITSNEEFNVGEEGVPLFLYTDAETPSLAKISTPESKSEEEEDTSSVLVLPVRDSLSNLSKAPNPAFHFQLQGTNKPGRTMTLFKRPFHGSDILLLLRRTKRTA